MFFELRSLSLSLCLYICMSVCLSLSLYLSLSVYIYKRVQLHGHGNVNAHVYANPRVHMCTYTYMYVCGVADQRPCTPTRLVNVNRNMHECEAAFLGSDSGFKEAVEYEGCQNLKRAFRAVQKTRRLQSKPPHVPIANMSHGVLSCRTPST